MGKVKQFNIFFRNNKAVYEVGRAVDGYVKLDLAEKSTIDCKWMEVQINRNMNFNS